MAQMMTNLVLLTLDAMPSGDLIRAARSSPLFAPAVRLVGVQVVLALVKGFAPLSPRERAPVAAGDPRLAHALVAEEQVSGAMLAFSPRSSRHYRSLWTPPDGMRAARVLALGEALALAEAVTMILKAIAGRPRSTTRRLSPRAAASTPPAPVGPLELRGRGLGSPVALGGAPRVHSRAFCRRPRRRVRFVVGALHPVPLALAPCRRGPHRAPPRPLPPPPRQACSLGTRGKPRRTAPAVIIFFLAALSSSRVRLCAVRQAALRNGPSCSRHHAPSRARRTSASVAAAPASSAPLTRPEPRRTLARCPGACPRRRAARRPARRAQP